MKRIDHKIIIYVTILALSIDIFIFAYSVFFMSKNKDGRDIKTFSECYIICEFRENQPKVMNIKQKLGDLYYLDYALMQRATRNIYLKFNKGFYKEILHDNYHTASGEVYVNSKTKRQCFEENDEIYIVLDGKKMRVEGFYDDDKYEIETGGSYINIDSGKLADFDNYDFLMLDMGDDISTEKIEEEMEKLSELFPEAEIRLFDGKKESMLDMSDKYVTFLMLMGTIICFNCMDFTDVWFNCYDDELKIRKMVGASKKANIIFMLREFINLFVIAVLIGLVLSLLTKSILDTERFIMLGSLLCQGFGFFAISMGITTTAFVSLVIIGLTAFWRSKRKGKIAV